MDACGMVNPHSNLYPESNMQLCRPRVGSASRHRARLALQPTCPGGVLKDVGVLRHPHPTHSHFPEPLEPPGSRTVSRGRWDERKAERGPSVPSRAVPTWQRNRVLRLGVGTSCARSTCVYFKRKFSGVALTRSAGPRRGLAGRTVSWQHRGGRSCVTRAGLGAEPF